MRIRRWLRPVATGMLVGLVSVSFAACGDDEEPNESASPSATESGDEAVDGESTVTIEMKDFAYAVSGDLAEGGSIEYTNTGDEYHMAAFMKLEEGKTAADVTEIIESFEEEEGGAGAEGEAEATEEETPRAAQSATSTTARRGATSTTAARGTATTAGRGTATTAAGEGEEGEGGDGGEEGGDPFEGVATQVGYPGSFLEPGGEATFSAADLEAGNYAILCFFDTEVEGEPHYAEGMIGELSVGGGEPPEEAEPAATYQLGEEGKITGPATLDAGEATLAFAGAGEDAADLQIIMIKPDAGKTFEDMDEAFTELFEGDNPPPKDAKSKVPGDVLFGAFPLGDVDGYSVTTELTAGTYYLVAEIQSEGESEEGPPPTGPPFKITVK